MTIDYGSIVREEKDDNSEDESQSLWSRRRIKHVILGGCVLIGLYYVSFHIVFKDAVLKYKRSNPSAALYYRQQRVDHLSSSSTAAFRQRYYENLDYFKGPGSPIFAILGGEDTLEKILYPFISEHLARDFGAYTICMEHRFYGASLPVTNPTNQDLQDLLTLDQAMLDYVQLIQHKQKEFGCGPRGSDTYCPVMTVGGSYPGFLSVLMRLVYPNIVDIGYASSAPLLLYSHKKKTSNVYYEKIASVADEALPGCANAVRLTLQRAQEQIIQSAKVSIARLANSMGICVETIPDYMKTREILAREVMMIVATHFAESNMDYYPPSPNTELVKQCSIFQKENLDWSDKIASFLSMSIGAEESCFDLLTELPPGPAGTISASDWSGVGGGWSGRMWDFQSCTLIPECGMSSASMFPPREWSIDWLTEHCQSRFEYTPQANALLEEYGFDDLSNVTRLLLTNGLNDGWSALSILQNISEGVVVFNMENGAHHSDLTHIGPSDTDTDDVVDAFRHISTIIGKWLTEVKTGSAT